MAWQQCVGCPFRPLCFQTPIYIEVHALPLLTRRCIRCIFNSVLNESNAIVVNAAVYIVRSRKAVFRRLR